MFTERGKTFTRFQCGWEFIPNDGCSNRESTLAQVQFSSGNSLPNNLRDCNSVIIFKKKLKKYFISIY